MLDWRVDGPNSQRKMEQLPAEVANGWKNCPPYILQLLSHGTRIPPSRRRHLVNLV